MFTIQQLEAEIEKDQHIHPANIKKEIQDTPVIVNKYIKYERILKSEILRLTRLKKETEFSLTEFYGPLGKKYKDRSPFPQKLTSKLAIEDYVKNDPDVRFISQHLEDAQIMLDYLQRWIDIHIRFRNQVCKNIFDVIAFENAGER